MMSNVNVENKINQACNRIAPAWPLESSVAVNPYLGLSNKSFDKAAEILKHRGDIQMYMPIAFYLEKIENSEIGIEDIEKVLRKRNVTLSVADFLLKVRNLDAGPNNLFKFETLMDIADLKSGIRVSELMIDHTSLWLATYFENKNSVQYSSSKQLFKSWQTEVSIDLLPELSGIKYFRRTAAMGPENYSLSILKGLEKLGIPNPLVEPYLHSLLLKLIGWSSFCAGIDWQNRLYGGDDNHIKALLGIIITWEVAIKKAFADLDSEWKVKLDELSNSYMENFNDEQLKTQSILQEAFDLSNRKKIISKIASNNKFNQEINKIRPIAQMIFCIDVRSEIYRRNLEAFDTRIETVGFAGFFGFPVKYTPINHEKGKNQCPVLIPSGPAVFETTNEESDHQKVKTSRAMKGKLDLAWSKFKSGSVSSYSFVSPLGLLYLPKLISDSFGWTRPVNNPKMEEFGSLLSGNGRLDITKIPFEDRLSMAKSALRAMGLTKNLAPLVFIIGHGSTSVNNPHASALDCGACGGNSGEINAITAQLILNDEKIRSALKKSDFEIPSDTYFVACLHDTTTDKILIIDEDKIPVYHNNELNEVKSAILLASEASRKDRAIRLRIKKGKEEYSIFKRARDWAQVRPEWGLAGCNAFVVAPRTRTIGLNLEGKAFLHSYNWKSDKGFKVLETIMTAPMIVTSWINLQYYASTVDNKRLGAGNKTLHNVTSGIGVLEGAKGDLRIGLPLQSVHDGTGYQHQPLRLNVVVEAPIEAINEILNNHSNVKQLCDGEWIFLMILNENGEITHQYGGNGNWESLNLNEQEILETKQLFIETI